MENVFLEEKLLKLRNGRVRIKFSAITILHVDACKHMCVEMNESFKKIVANVIFYVKCYIYIRKNRQT